MRGIALAILTLRQKNDLRDTIFNPTLTIIFNRKLAPVVINSRRQVGRLVSPTHSMSHHKQRQCHNQQQWPLTQ